MRQTEPSHTGDVVGHLLEIAVGNVQKLTFLYQLEFFLSRISDFQVHFFFPAEEFDHLEHAHDYLEYS